MSAPMDYLKIDNHALRLSNGRALPYLGLGTWMLPPSLTAEVVRAGVNCGYRLFDTSVTYGNQAEVGKCLRECLDDGQVSRNDLFVTSKVWCNMMKPEGVRTAAEMSLGLLQMDQIDVLMINWPMAFQDTEGRMFPVDDWGNLAFSDEDYLTTWKAMEELVDDELVRSLGVCNFNSAQLDRLMQHCDVKPLVNQVECHPWLNQAELLAECRKRQVALQGYAPLGSPDRPWREEDEELLIADATVCRIASKHGCPPAHILLKFQIDRGIPVITKTRLESRVQDYQQALRFKLEREDWDALMQLDRGENGRLFAFQEAADHPHYPFKQPALGIASIIVDYQ